MATNYNPLMMLTSTALLLFNLVPSSSFTDVNTPDCEGIQVLCNRPIRSCCNGQCCPFMKEFQSNHVDLPSLSQTASQYAQEWLLEQSSTNLPQRNEQCVSSSPEPYQCADGGPSGTGSLRCKFDGTVTSQGILTGKCKLNTGFSGCRRDSDCYDFNNVCKSSVCVKGTSSTWSAAKSNIEHVNEIEIVPQAEETPAHHEQHTNDKLAQQWKEMPGNAQAAIISGCAAALVLFCIVLKCCYVMCAASKPGYNDALSHVDRKQTQDDVSYDVECGVSAVDHVNESSDELVH